ncbi:neural cell adhesion molecule 2-like isoform X2 [Daphnia pulicaria]|uniref:neural cell adhesion molecule 2-like isoform X2 n=1 Tax=Daphnia pulicaria TaxID=35523 RepID=UPI001EEAF18C|nr:neural cell adhesion molecule 2-like isoform X2 [Daphnia pulicaria]
MTTAGRSSKVKKMLQLTQDGGSSRSGDVAGHHWHSTSRGIARIPFSSGGAQEAKGERGSESVVGKRRRRRSETGSKEPRRLALQLRLAHPVARLLLALLLLTLMACRPCHGHDPELFDMDDEDGPLQHVVSVVKGKTNLPCDITPPVEDDQASLVLFYKDDASPSIYTYDARDKYANRPRHWSDDNVLGKRAFFSTVLMQNNYSSSGCLMIDNVRESDAGLYRCRVDFKRSPTRNSRVNLTVVVPPKQMKITTEKGVDVDDIIGPFDEDATLILVCIVTGGNPTPEVTWWQEERMIDRHAEVRHSEQGVARNVLQLERLGRVDLRTKLSCHASNTQLSQPLTKSVEIELNLKPLDVRILSSRQPLSSGKKYDLTCQTAGSRPPPTVTWWKDGQLLRRSQETPYDGGNVTLSQLTVQLTPEDDGKKLVCRVENPALGPASAVEDSWLLDVYYVPRVRLELGRNLESEHIREGIDVYFDCHVTARPSAVRLVWRHQGNVLQHNVSAGVIISESSLVLQRVARSSAGRYTCHASNAEGEGSSSPFHLHVAHKPVCRPEQKNSYGGAKGLTSEVECHVESKPGATSFRWTFNGTGELVDLTSGYRTTADGSISILRYTPRSEMDFGTLLCWAANPLGLQSQPCVFHFYAAGVPDPPRNCSISNQTLSSFEIDCAEGYDGGIPQHFKMHVFDIKTRALLANLTSSSPRFALHLGSSSGPSGLSPGGSDENPKTHSWKSGGGSSNNNLITIDEAPNNKTARRHSNGGAGSANGGGGNVFFGSIAVIPPVGTLLQVTAVNAHGVSESVFIEATQQAVVGLLPAEMQAAGGAGGGGGFSNFEMTPTLGILIGIVATGVFMMATLIAALRFRQRKNKPGTSGGANHLNHQSASVISKDKDRDMDSYNGNEYIELGTKDPDVIGKDKSGMESMPHIISNPLDLMANGRTPSSASTLPLRGDSPAGSSSAVRSSQEEVVYAELTLSRHRPTHLAVPSGKLPVGTTDPVATTAGPTDGVVYAQIDHTLKRKQQQQQSHKRIRSEAPPPPTTTAAQLSTFQQPLLQQQHHHHHQVVLPDVSQTMTAHGNNIRETILM